MTKNNICAIAMIVGLAHAISASAGTGISVDWGANTTDTLGAYIAPMAAGETAGVVPLSHWNSYINNTQTTPVSLTDGTGAATTARATWRDGITWCYTPTSNTADTHMMQAFLTAYGRLPDMTYPSVSVTGIPYGQYDVYVYAEYSTHAGNDYDLVASYTIGSQTLWIQNARTARFNGTYIEAAGSSDAGLATPVGNYVHFRNLSASSFTLATGAGAPLGGNDWPVAAINGLQIVPVPEPTCLGLFCAAGIVLRRRRDR